ncbi:hypothetical protein CAPTEDRAFT_209995 [Capitella teleta]|uniref:Uncharacterized protein n=1 Tax=Capitella teleta TaxID=283909 RepID=R7VGG1_CAPTE|nr:hypothetical protein CAPTEDRAFT_209995 [Capitella teleta]|eukprot:ELU14770.1 hypothetical protein CAPTEDRAFT_209995 [Capitella teleta]
MNMYSFKLQCGAYYDLGAPVPTSRYNLTTVGTYSYTTSTLPTEEISDVEEIFDAIKIWVPIVLTLLLVLLLCFATIRSKAKRRREREGGTSDPMRTISGGVSTNVNAYRNYGVYIQRQQQTDGSVPRGVTPQEALSTLSYSEPPPSYEDTMKQTGVINASFSQSQENLPTTPPPYPAEPSQSGSSQSSTAKDDTAPAANPAAEASNDSPSSSSDL